MECFNGSIKLFSDWMRKKNSLPLFGEFIDENCVTPGAFATYVEATDEKKLFGLFEELGVEDEVQFLAVLSRFAPWYRTLEPLPVSELKMDWDDAMDAKFVNLSNHSLILMFRAIGMEDQAELLQAKQYTGKELTANGITFDKLKKALKIPEDDLFIEIKMTQIQHFLLELIWLHQWRKDIFKKVKLFTKNDTYAKVHYQPKPFAKKQPMYFLKRAKNAQGNIKRNTFGLSHYTLLHPKDGHADMSNPRDSVLPWQIWGADPKQRSW